MIYTVTQVPSAESHRNPVCCGYYTTVEDALRICTQNPIANDWSETRYYKYVLVEAYAPGLYSCAQECQWYSINEDDTLTPCERPPEWACVVNFGL